MKQTLKINVRTPKQEAEIRGCDVTYIYRLMREGKINTVDIAGKKFVKA
jgi:hypothetical protein